MYYFNCCDISHNIFCYIYYALFIQIHCTKWRSPRSFQRTRSQFGGRSTLTCYLLLHLFANQEHTQQFGVSVWYKSSIYLNNLSRLFSLSVVALLSVIHRWFTLWARLALDLFHPRPRIPFGLWRRECSWTTIRKCRWRYDNALRGCMPKVDWQPSIKALRLVISVSARQWSILLSTSLSNPNW